MFKNPQLEVTGQGVSWAPPLLGNFPSLHVSVRAAILYKVILTPWAQIMAKRYVTWVLREAGTEN